jgi:hypothetical protein
MAETVALSTSAVAAAVDAARRTRVQLARTNPATFCELVLRDERTGSPVQLAPLHEEWLHLLGAHDRLVLMAAFELGKSSIVSIGHVLAELARDPSKRIAVVSNTAHQARKLVSAVKQYIETSTELKAVAPHLKRGAVWRDDFIQVARGVTGKDASLLGVGLHGAVLGSRIDELILDDAEDFESTATEAAREKTLAWVKSTLLTRLTANARVVALGTPWARNDLLASLAKLPGWRTYKFPVVDPTTGQPSWPSRWPEARIAATRAQLGVFDAARMLDLQPRADEDAIIKPEWLDLALKRGDGKPLIPHLLHVPDGCFVVVGVDLAVSLEKSADETALVSILVGGGADGRDRQVVDVQAGRWPVDEILRRIVSTARRYANSRVVVETVAAQAYVKQLVKDRAPELRVEGFTTGAGRMSLPFQLELLGNEMAEGKWIIPNNGGVCAPAVARLVADLGGYSVGDHLPDRVSGLLMSRWGAQRGAMVARVIPWNGLAR